MPRVLHVGCGQPGTVSGRLPSCFDGWAETRLDIEPAAEPDIVSSMTHMPAIASASFDAIWSRNNVEHLDWHEVGLALREFRRVLTPTGFALIVVPDLQLIGEFLVQDRLEEPIWRSAAGPISPIDILYGFRPSLEIGAKAMAHRTGFTARSLAERIAGSGFAEVTVAKKTDTIELWAEARMTRGYPKIITDETPVTKQWPRI